MAHTVRNAWVCQWGCESGPTQSPELHVDYAFFRNEKSDEERVTLLVGRERRSCALIAHVVPKKGTGGGLIIHQLELVVRRLGCSKKSMI